MPFYRGMMAACMMMLMAAAAASGVAGGEVSAPAYAISDGTVGVSYRLAVGAVPECETIFAALVPGQVFQCSQNGTNPGSATVVATGGTLSVSISLRDPWWNEWNCSNKRAARTAKVMSLLMMMVAQGVHDKHPQRFAAGLAGMCVSLLNMTTRGEDHARAPAPGGPRLIAASPSAVSSKAMEYKGTYGVFAYLVVEWKELSEEPIAHCGPLFQYLQQNHQLMLCDSPGSYPFEAGAAFMAFNGTLSYVIKWTSTAPKLHCANLAGGNQVTLSSGLADDLAYSLNNGDRALFRASMAAACTLLDPALRAA